jgi:oxygen-independent coproporphyrinogen-3 oxidase
MLFGVYFHIPYCIQRCTYCDFATYEQSQILPPDNYTRLVVKEIAAKKDLFLQGASSRKVNTIYFGGGTPSLFSIENIVLLLESLSREGFDYGPDAEMTIEINPGTVDEKKLNQYLELGFNRFSLGAQTFNQKHLTRVHREHSVQQTLDSLDLFKRYKLNFNFDILFGLPHQSLDELIYDVQQAVGLGSTHVSPYYLTVPEGHPLSKNRPEEDAQVTMFDIIESELLKSGFYRYEISNYAKPGFESKHNLLYWTDQEYAGFGLSSHSYVKNNFASKTPWGSRFWNPNNIKIYEKEISDLTTKKDFKYTSPFDFEAKYFEVLAENQSLTDFCHTSLRIAQGIDLSLLKTKFSVPFYEQVVNKLKDLNANGLLEPTPRGFTLSAKGKMISNFVFQRLTF